MNVSHTNSFKYNQDHKTTITLVHNFVINYITISLKKIYNIKFIHQTKPNDLTNFIW